MKAGNEVVPKNLHKSLNAIGRGVDQPNAEKQHDTYLLPRNHPVMTPSYTELL